MAYRRELWRIISGSEVRFMWNITALMRPESDRYFQGKQNVEAYIDESKDLVDLSGYTDPIAIVLKFHRGPNSMTQDRIAKSGTDRLGDTDFNGWFKAA
jgi:hypothetical protein